MSAITIQGYTDIVRKEGTKVDYTAVPHKKIDCRTMYSITTYDQALAQRW